MKDRANIAESVTFAFNRVQEQLSIHVISILQGDEILPFLVITQAIHDQDVINAPIVQRPDQGAAYHASAAGDNVTSFVIVSHSDIIGNYVRYVGKRKTGK